ncbi:hypothetical protein HWV62_9805 [Athelia sp. TMB]|nr:hypothetical protein HWV62_9805 [Athelia sp. TMB]
MKAIATFHKPSSVSSSAKCKLLPGSDLEFLVVVKLDRLEVFSLQPEGLKLECELEVWGRLLSIIAVPVGEEGYDNLIILADHPDPELIFLSYAVKNGVGELQTKHHLSLFERSGRAAEYLTGMILDRSGTIMAVSCYAGKLKLVVLAEGIYDSDFDVSLPELNLLALSFLDTDGEPDDSDLCLAILHVDHEQRLQLLSRDLSIPEQQLRPKPSTLLPSIPLPMKLFLISADCLPIIIAVPPSSEDADVLGGVLVLGGRKVLFYDLAPPKAQVKAQGKQKRTEKKKRAAEKDGDANELEKAKQKEEERMWKKKKSRSWIDWPWSTVETYCTIFEGRYLVADAYGKLAMLSVDGSAERKLTLLVLGETSPPTTISYLTSQIAYIGSHFGDSQVIRIHAAPASAFDSPTLPVPPEIPTITPSQLTELFTSGKGKSKAVNGEDIREKEGRGVIVLGKGTYLSTIQSFKNIAPIMDAALVDVDRSGQNQIITCSGGRHTGSLNIVRNGADFQAQATVEGLSNITNMWPLRASFQVDEHTHLLVTTLRISHLFRFEKASRISGVHPSATELITSEATLAINNVYDRRFINGKSTYNDGTLVVQATKSGLRMYEYDMGLGSYIKVGKDWIPNQEIVAASLNNSQYVLGLSGGRLVLFNSNQKDLNELLSIYTSHGEISAVTCVPMNRNSRFTNKIAVSFWGSNKVAIYSTRDLNLLYTSSELPALPRSLLFYNFDAENSAEASQLLVGLADGTAVSFKDHKDQSGVISLEEDKVITLGELPVFLTACKAENKDAVFACGSRASILSWKKQSLQHSAVNLKIPTGLELPRRISHHRELKAYGVVSSQTQPTRIGVAESVHSTFKVLNDVTLDIGVCRYNAGEVEPTNGQLLIFSMANKKEVHMKPAGSAEVHGCIFAFANVNGKLAVAVNSSVLVYALTLEGKDDARAITLHKVAEWNHNYFVVSLVSRNKTLMLGDAISSISFIDFDENQLKVVARDYGSLWPVCIEAWNDTSVIGANVS